MQSGLARAGATLIGLAAILAAACGGPAAPSRLEATAAETPAATATASPAAGDGAASATADPYATARAELVAAGVVAYGIVDASVIEAMQSVPRHEFVPANVRDLAYENHPLPIGFGQTISQPYIVALMSEAAEVEPDDIVLEIGTGSGYQAAVLARLAQQVYSIEIIGDLADRAAGDLQRLGFDNVTVRHADGYFGWENEAPFDAILVTAAPDHIPPPLVQQLDIGAHMIIPVGPVGAVQTLWRVTRVSEADVRTENLGAVSFVPLTRAGE